MTEQSVTPRASTQQTREMLVSLYVRGSTNDAKAMYSASPGASDAGWQALERMLSPVKSFIADGGTPYTAVAQSTEYAGIPVPPPEEEPATETRSFHGPTQAEAGNGTSAAELIARAEKAESEDELKEIERLGGNRVTVQDAVYDRREELAARAKKK